MIPRSECEEGLICAHTELYYADAPGTCRKPCETSIDCEESYYCAEKGVCLPDSKCLVDVDCTNEDNDFIQPLCFPALLYCSRTTETCGVSCTGIIPCSSPYDCPQTHDCDFYEGICVERNDCECTEPIPDIPHVYCSDGSTGGPFCTRNQNTDDCEWQIRECPTDCVCTNPAPRVAACPDGSARTPYCGDLGDSQGCGWIVPECPICDCTTFPVPEIAKYCDDGSYASPVCISTPSGCTIEFDCPSDTCLAADGTQCNHPMGGRCLGVCSQNQCVLNSYDMCARSPAMVIYLTLHKSTPADSLLNDLSTFSLLPKDKIQILDSSTRQFNVEFLSSNNLSADEAVNKLKHSISSGKTKDTSLDSAKVIVLTQGFGYSAIEVEPNSSSLLIANSSLLIALIPLLALLLI